MSAGESFAVRLQTNEKCNAHCLLLAVTVLAGNPLQKKLLIPTF